MNSMNREQGYLIRLSCVRAKSQTFTLTMTSISSSDVPLHLAACLWMVEGNPRRHRDNLQTPQKNCSACWIEFPPRTFLAVKLWHCPSVAIHTKTSMQKNSLMQDVPSELLSQIYRPFKEHVSLHPIHSSL